MRTVETIQSGKAETPFLKAGDTVRIWMEDERHHPIFGVIEQAVNGCSDFEADGITCRLGNRGKQANAESIWFSLNRIDSGAGPGLAIPSGSGIAGAAFTDGSPSWPLSHPFAGTIRSCSMRS